MTETNVNVDKDLPAFEPPSFAAATVAGARAALWQFASGLIIPLFQAAFLLALAVAIFLVGRVYHTDVTSLDMQWMFLPWIAAVFVPALAMQAFAESPGDRRMELIASLPMTASALVVGCWIAGLAVLLATLALTFPFPVTMAYLGDLDGGTAFAGYIGAAGFLAVSYAFALLASAAMRNPVGGYVLGALLLIGLQLTASDTAVSLLRGTLAEPILTHLPKLTPGYWLNSMASGRISIGGVVYVFLATTILLVAAAGVLERRRKNMLAMDDLAFTRFARAFAWLLVAALLFAGSVTTDVGVDLTEEREFTLHPQTRAIAEKAQPGTRINFYWSASNLDVPPVIRQHAVRVERTLRQIAELSHGSITLNRHETAPDTEAEDEARAGGIEGVALSSGGQFMLGAAFARGERRASIGYFSPERAPVLEYDAASTLAALGRETTPRLGILSPLLTPRDATQPREGLAILEEIKRQYDVAIIPHFADALPEGLDALLVIDATILKPDMLRSIDRHVMAGRGLVVMLDPLVRFNSASNSVVPEPGEEINDISDLLLRYGVRFEAQDVVGDSALASTVGVGNEKIQYPLWLRVRRPQLSPTHPAVAGLNELGFAEPGALTIVVQDGVVPLVATTDGAGSLPRSTVRGGSPQKNANDLKPGGGRRLIAAAIEGRVESAFAQPGAVRAESEDTKRADARVYVIADVDWIFDPLTYTATTGSDGRKYSRPLNDNIAAVSNLLEAASRRTSLARIRSRGKLNRPFVRVSELLRASSERYRAKETELTTRIAGVEDNVRKALELSGARKLTELPDKIQGNVNELRRALLPYRRELRSLRQMMREDVEGLGRWLAILNLLAAPVLVILLTIGVRIGRRWSMRRIIS